MKKVEFRKRNVPLTTKRVFVYETAPSSSVIGFFDVENVDERSPKTLWRQHRAIGGIDRKRYFDYYSDCPTGRALLIAKAVRFRTPQKLPEHMSLPQSFVYLNQETSEQLIFNGRSRGGIS